MKQKKVKKDIWEQIKEHQKDPKFILAAHEFISLTTGRSPK